MLILSHFLILTPPFKWRQKIKYLNSLSPSFTPSQNTNTSPFSFKYSLLAILRTQIKKPMILLRYFSSSKFLFYLSTYTNQPPPSPLRQMRIYLHITTKRRVQDPLVIALQLKQKFKGIPFLLIVPLFCALNFESFFFFFFF